MGRWQCLYLAGEGGHDDGPAAAHVQRDVRRRGGADSDDGGERQGEAHGPPEPPRVLHQNGSEMR